MALAPDAQSLVDRGQNGIALIAHMCRINATKFPRFRRERDQFFRLRVRSRSVLEGSREPNCAFTHRLLDQSLHLIELSRGRLLIVVSQHHAPDLRGADVAGKIYPHPLFFQTSKILLKSAPIRCEMIVLVTLLVGSDDGVILRRDRAAFASNLRGDALVNLRRQSGFDEDGQLRLAQHVDEARSHDHAAGVDGSIPWSSSKIPNGRNFSGANPDVARIPRRSGAIDDVAICDDDVEGRGKGHGL